MRHAEFTYLVPYIMQRWDISEHGRTCFCLISKIFLKPCTLVFLPLANSSVCVIHHICDVQEYVTVPVYQILYRTPENRVQNV